MEVNSEVVMDKAVSGRVEDDPGGVGVQEMVGMEKSGGGEEMVVGEAGGMDGEDAMVQEVGGVDGEEPMDGAFGGGDRAQGRVGLDGDAGDAEDAEDAFLDENEDEVIELGEGDGVNDDEDMEDAAGEDNEVIDEDVDVDVDDTLVDLGGHTNSVFVVACSPADHNVIATGGADDRALIHDVRNNKITAKIEGLGDSVGCAAFSADGKLVAFGVMNGTVVVLELETGEELFKPEPCGDAVEWLEYHPRGPFLIGGSADCMAYMWNGKGELAQVFAGHTGSVTCGRFSPDGRNVVTGSEDGTVRVWGPKDGACVVTSEPANAEKPGVLCMDLSTGPGGSPTVAIVGYADGSVRLLNLTSGATLASLPPHSESVEAVAFSLPTSVPQMCATGGMDGVIKVWDLDQQKLRCELVHEGGVSRCRWHPTKPELLVSAGGDRTVRVWDAKNAAPLAVFSGNRNAILSMEVGTTGEFVVTGGDDHHVRLFSLYQQ